MMKNDIFRNEKTVFETAGIKFTAVFSDALPPNGDELRIICADGKEISVSSSGETFAVKENCALALPKNAEAKITGEKAAVFSVVAERGEKEAKEDLFAMFSEFFDAVEPVCIEKADELASLVKKGLRVSEAKEKGCSARLEAIAAEIVFELYELISALTVRLSDDCGKTLAERTRTPQMRDIFIDRYLKENFRTDISLGSLAKKAGVSPRQLNRIFDRNYGTTFYKYLTGLRIAEAKKLLLKKPTLPVEEIAYAVGYSTYTGFHNAFKKETGLLPGEYRRRKH